MNQDGAPDPPEDWVLTALRQYETPLLRYAAWLLRDADRAKDVVQDAFLRLCQQERSAVEDRLPQWLFTVCRNRVIDLKRREAVAANGSAPPDVDERDIDDALAMLERQTLLGEILRIVDGLPADQREVVYLRFRGGFSYKRDQRVNGSLGW